MHKTKDVSQFNSEEKKVLEFIESGIKFSLKELNQALKVNMTSNKFSNFLSKCEAYGILLYEEGERFDIKYCLFRNSS